jgi:hypothetical protein
MKFGVREICDVVLKAKSAQKVGNKIFYKNEPVIYFDTLKTSSMEGAATTVYAQGGRGNSRLIAWEGERTVTFTMEDALISPAGFAILSGAGLFEAASDNKIYVHTTEQTDAVVKSGNNIFIYLKEEPHTSASENFIYVMALKNGEVVSEPYIPTYVGVETEEGNYTGMYKIQLKPDDTNLTYFFDTGVVVLVDYYVEKSSGAQQIDISPDKFGGNYYLEASTLFRDTNGVDLPAEFVIPNCKIQSNFTFTMASSGDPSTFTFTIDAFPDYTRFNKTKKVLAAIQIIDTTDASNLIARTAPTFSASDNADITRDKTWTEKQPNED